MRNKIADAIGSFDLLPLKPSSFSNYCLVSFFPVGIVEKVLLSENNNVVQKYRLTEEGYYFARPLAAFSLYWVSQNSKSLYSIFGNSFSSGETKSPYNRAKILRDLRDKNLRQVDLMSKLNFCFNEQIHQHLLSLKREGLINYETIGTRRGKGEFLYEVNKDLDKMKK